MDGTDVKTTLAEYGLTQQWLRKQLDRKGMVCDTADISRAVNGLSHTKKAQAIISSSLDVLKVYNETFGRAAI